MRPRQHVESAGSAERHPNAPGRRQETNEALQKEIAGRRQAEEALRRSETKFRTLFVSTSDALLLADEKGSFIDCNPAGLAMFGCASIEEFCAKHPADLSPPTQPDGTDSRMLANRQIATALEKGSHRFDWLHKRLNTGETFPAEVHLNAMTLDGKRVILGSIRDLTDRQQVEEMVRKTLVTQRAILDRTNDFIWAVNAHDFGMLTFNRAFRDYSLEQRGHRLQIGERPEDLLPNADYIERWRGYFQRALASGPFTTEYLSVSGKITLLLTFNLLKHNEAVFGVSVFGKDITELKRTCEELKESEERLRLAANAAKFGIYRYDFATGAGYWSPELKALLGVPGEQALALDEDKLFVGLHPEDRPGFLAAMTAANDPLGSGFLLHDYRVIHPNGEVHWLQVRGHTTFSGEGAERRAAQATGVVLDITERRRLEDQIEEVLKQREAILDVSPMGISLNKGRIIHWANPALCAMFGYPPEELHGMDTAALFVREEDYKRVGRETAAQLAQGLTCTVESEFKRKNGTRLWTFAQGRALDPADLSAGVIWMLMDITQGRQAEEALRKSQRELAEAQRVARMGSWSFNARTKVVAWSDELYRIFGLEKSEFGGTHEAFAACVHPEDRPRVLQTNAYALAHGEPFDIQYRIVTPAGEFKVIEETGRPILDETGQLAGLIGTAQNITERKEAERKMQMFSHEIVTARENERRHLSSVLHHDVGSLAVGISAYLDAMEEDLRSKKPGKALRWMPRTRKLLEQSLKRLKGLAVGLRPPELEVLGLSASLRQHFSLVRKRSRIRIRFRESHDGRRLIGDTAIVVFRVAQEALTNAIKHGLAKRVTVDLLTLRKEVRLTIRDNGKGFNPADHTNLPLSHLGLRVMREMADYVGGAFTFDSRPGRGTTVRLSLPIKTAPAAAPRRRGRGLKPAGAAARKASRARGRKIGAAARSSRARKGRRA